MSEQTSLLRNDCDISKSKRVHSTCWRVKFSLNKRLDSKPTKWLRSALWLSSDTLSFFSCFSCTQLQHNPLCQLQKEQAEIQRACLLKHIPRLALSLSPINKRKAPVCVSLAFSFSIWTCIYLELKCAVCIIIQSPQVNISSFYSNDKLFGQSVAFFLLGRYCLCVWKL